VHKIQFILVIILEKFVWRYIVSGAIFAWCDVSDIVTCWNRILSILCKAKILY